MSFSPNRQQEDRRTASERTRLANARRLQMVGHFGWSADSRPTAKGVHRANYTRRVAGNKPWAIKPEHDWILTPVEPVISEELWQKCNDSLEARKTKLARPAKHVAHLFAGLTSCVCGKKMYVPSNSPKYVCTGCRNKIPIVDLEAVFLDELKNYLLSPDKVAAYLKAANATIGEKTQLLDTVRSELQKVKQQADQTYQLYLKEGLTVQQFKEIYQPLDARKRQLEEEIPHVEAEVDLLKIDGLSSEQIMAEARDLHSRWPKMNHDERRRIVELLVKNVVIGHGEITLNLCYLPYFEEMTNRQHHALPFCHLQIQAMRCSYPHLWKCAQTVSMQPKTLGEHIRKRRIEKHLLQAELAKLLGVDRVSVQNWERGIHEPNSKIIGKIIGFLGYNPEPKPKQVTPQ